MQGLACWVKENANKTGIFFNIVRKYVANGFITPEIGDLLINSSIEDPKIMSEMMDIAISSYKYKYLLISIILDTPLAYTEEENRHELYQAWGYEILEDPISDIQRQFRFTNIPPNESWLNFIESNKLGPIKIISIPKESLSTLNLSTSTSEDYTYNLLHLVDSGIAEAYKTNPNSFAFRTFLGSQSRFSEYGNYDEFIERFGVDMNLQTGWKGIWIGKGKLWGSKLPIPKPGETLYVLVYNNITNSFDFPGLFEEGAISFEGLVSNELTLRDLLLEGIVIKVLF